MPGGDIVKLNVRNRMEELRDETNADNPVEVVRKSLAVCDYLWTRKKSGAKILVEDSEGTRELIILRVVMLATHLFFKSSFLIAIRGEVLVHFLGKGRAFFGLKTNYSKFFDKKESAFCSHRHRAQAKQ